MTVSQPQDALQRIRGTPPEDLGVPELRKLARAVKALPEGVLQQLHLVVLSSFTTNVLEPYLVVESARHGLALDTFYGGFGQFEQALLSDGWRGQEGVPEALVLALRLEDLDADIPFRFYQEGRGSFSRLVGDAIARLESTVALFRDRSPGPVLVANFALPHPSPLTVFDANDPDSLTHEVHAANRELATRLRDVPGVHVWDYSGLVAARGLATWTDPRLWSLARAPVATLNQPSLAAHLVRTLRGVIRPSAKCLVLDLDDTLWGGAIGDEGIEGIALGDDHPGAAFKRFQRAILGLRDRGLLLAVCSANDEAVALGALSSHPEMLVSPSDFACMRINWSPKSENLREIAAELNIGLDALVFFDDNPVVRAEVRAQVPDVRVIEVPDDPALYVHALASIPELDSPALTSEDRIRARSYQAEAGRRSAMVKAASMEEFLESLEMKVEIGRLDARTAGRIGQLFAKTNQFNLTTRRRTQGALELMAQNAGVFWLRLEDRYGDMGIISTATLQRDGDDAVIESLILSCRAANRGIERTMVAHLAGEARALGCSTLVGEYAPTQRNHVVADLYTRLGFDVAGESDGVLRYRLDLTSEDLRIPTYITVDVVEADWNPEQGGLRASRP